MEDGQFLFNIWNKSKKDDENIELTKEPLDDEDQLNNNNNKDTGIINTYLTKLPNIIFGTDDDETKNAPPDSPIDEKDESTKADEEVAGIMGQSEDVPEGEEDPGVIDKYIRPLWPFGGDEKTSEAEEAEPPSDVAETESIGNDSVLISMKVLEPDEELPPPPGEEELPAYMVEDELAVKQEEEVQENQAPGADFPEYATISTVRDTTELNNGEPEAIAAMEAAIATPPETPSVSEMAIYSTKNGEGEVELVPPQKPARKKNRDDRCKAFWIPLLCFLLAAGILVFLLWFSGLFERTSKPKPVPTEAPVSDCRNGWTHYSGSCYYFSGEEKNWTAAASHCKTKCRTANLLVINDPEEQDFLEAQYSMGYDHNYFWIGCQDMDEDGTWNCEDNSGMTFTEGGGQIGYWDWNPREPSFGERNEFCVEYRVNGWNDHPCAAYNHYICEYKLQTETVATRSPPEAIIQTPPIDVILVDLSLYLDILYAPGYYNPSSKEYEDLKDNITMALDSLFSNNLDDLYNDTNVALISFNSTHINTKVELDLSLNDAPQIIGTDDVKNLSEDEVIDLIEQATTDRINDVFTDNSSKEILDSIGYVDGSVEIGEPIVVLQPVTTQSAITTELSTTSQLSSTQLTTEQPTTTAQTTLNPVTSVQTTSQTTAAQTTSQTTAAQTTSQTTAAQTTLHQTSAALTSEQLTTRSITTPQQTTEQVITTEVQLTTNLQTAGMTTEDPCVEWEPATFIPCQLPYATTYFPNFITGNITGYENIVNAELKLRHIYVRYRSCPLNFFCGIAFPGCPKAPEGQVAVCRGFCENIAKDTECSKGFPDIGLNLQDICKLLPEVPYKGSEEFCTF